MKSKLTTCLIAATLSSVVLAAPLCSVAQEHQRKLHYKVINLGTPGRNVKRGERH